MAVGPEKIMMMMIIITLPDSDATQHITTAQPNKKIYKTGWLGNVVVVCDLQTKTLLCFNTYFFNANTIHNCIQLKLRGFLKKNRKLSNEIKMCIICTLNMWQW